MRTCTTMLVLLSACASSQPKQSEPQPASVHSGGQTSEQTAAASEPTSTVASQPPSMASTTTSAPSCTPQPEPKIVTGDAKVTDSPDKGEAIIFDVAGIAIEVPPCTPEADLRLITVAWETANRPSAGRINPNFTRHAATLSVDQPITAAESAPLLVRLHSKKQLAKPGEKLVLAVESAGECDEAHKRDKLESGDCSHWQLFDTAFDPQRNEMVARVPALHGHRLQFGWVPNK